MRHLPHANLYRPFGAFFNKYKINMHIITYIISPA